MKISFEFTPLEVSEAQHCFGVRALIAQRLSNAIIDKTDGSWKFGYEATEFTLTLEQVKTVLDSAINEYLDHDLEMLQMNVELATGEKMVVDDLWADELWESDKIPQLSDEYMQTNEAKQIEASLTQSEKDSVFRSVKHSAKFFKSGSVAIEIADDYSSKVISPE